MIHDTKVSCAIEEEDKVSSNQSESKGAGVGTVFGKDIGATHDNAQYLWPPEPPRRDPWHRAKSKC